MIKYTPLLLIFVFCTNVFAEGGSSSVGDGGIGAICDNVPKEREIELFDLFESRVQNRESEIQLGNKELSLRDKVALGLSRLILPASETNRVYRAADQFIRFRIDPWELGLAWQYSHFLLPHIDIAADAEDSLNRNDCDLVVLAIRPNDNDSYDGLCSHSKAGREYCFLVSEKHFRQMKKDQQACLVIHEALRFLPNAQTEEQLRLLTTKLCTGK